jgi:hypothetical protein
VSAAWYGRDTTSDAAPEGTALVLHFTPNRLTWGATERAMKDIPLISGRSLTISDLKEFVAGELSVFVDEDGVRSLAVRLSSDRIPTKLLDSLGILAREVKPDVFLLSASPMPDMAWKPRHVWFGMWHWPWKRRIGSIHLIEGGTMSGAIYASSRATELRLPNQKLSELPWKTLPTGTIEAMSTPVLPNVDLSGVASLLKETLVSLDSPPAGALIDQLNTKKGAILLTQQDNVVSFLVSSSSENFDKTQQQKLIRSSSAFQNPKISDIRLPDNTTAAEILVDPGLITVEETTIGGVLASRVAAKNGQYLYAAEKDSLFAVTNSQSLLEFWLKGGTSSTRGERCGGNAVYIDVSALKTLSSSQMHSRSVDAMTLFPNQYNQIAVDNGLSFDTIRLCR